MKSKVLNSTFSGFEFSAFEFISDFGIRASDLKRLDAGEV